MTLFYSTILALATFIWGWVFYKKEYHPQPKKVIFISFMGGMLSMIPLFTYKFIYENYLPRLSDIAVVNLLWRSSILSGLFFFVINMLIITVLLTILSGVINLFLTKFKHETLANIQGTLKDDEFEFVTMSTMIALLIYGQRIVENTFNINIINTVVGTILFLAIIEEYVKHLTVRFIDDKKIKDIDDAITLSIIVGLAFAFVENIIYAINVGSMAVVLPRALLSIPIHLIASGIFGYYYGLAHFADPIMKAKHITGKYKIKFKWLHTVLSMRKSEVYREEKTAEGLVLATVFHTLANILFELNLAFITVPLIVLGLVILSYFYKESHLLYRMLHRKR